MYTSQLKTKNISNNYIFEMSDVNTSSFQVTVQMLFHPIPQKHLKAISRDKQGSVQVKTEVLTQ